MKKYLQASGLLPTTAAALKGVFDRGQPLLQLGLVITNAIAVSSLPALINQQKKQSNQIVRWKVQQLFQLALLFAFAAAIGLTVLMPQINWVLFGSTQGSFALAVNSLTIPLATIIILDNVLLQIEEQQVAAFKVILLIIIGKIFFNWLLITPYGINGAAWGSVLSLLVGMIAAGRLEKNVGFSYLRTAGWFRKLLITMSVMGISVKITALLIQNQVSFSRLGSFWVLLAAIPIGIIAFFACTLRFQLLDQKFLN